MTSLKARLSSLFIEKTNSGLVQSFRYFFVGGLSFVIDSLALFIFVQLDVYYLISSSIAFLIGLAVNFFLSKQFIFTTASEITTPIGEFISYGLIGVAGLVLTDLLMYFFTDVIGFFFMVSKLLSAVIVLEWNFLSRKLLLYRQKTNPVE